VWSVIDWRCCCFFGAQFLAGKLAIGGCRCEGKLLVPSTLYHHHHHHHRMQGTTDQRSATKLCPSCCSASLTLSFGFCVCVWVWAFNFDFQLDFFWLATFWAVVFCGVGMGQEHALPQPFPQLPRVHPKCNESAMSGAYA